MADLWPFFVKINCPHLPHIWPIHVRFCIRIASNGLQSQVYIKQLSSFAAILNMKTIPSLNLRNSTIHSMILIFGMKIGLYRDDAHVCVFLWISLIDK